MALASLSGGSAGSLLLLLHGMGANAAVWGGLLPRIAADWPGRWLAPDFRGHGCSPQGEAYDLDTHVADLQVLIGDEPDVTILGHSMGGAVAIALAARQPSVRRVVAFGVKNAWDPDLVARLRQMAAAPAKVFATEAEARDRYLIASGLKGLADTQAETAGRGVRTVEGGYALAMDPGAYAIAGVGVEAEARALGDRLTLYRGETDGLVGSNEWDGSGVVSHRLVGVGHNPHVEDPSGLWGIVAPQLLT